MGVKDLWQLLSPVGRRLSLESLEGKTLAIDASIWITQFIKAMRDDDGNLIKNAHILGTIKRILKLLFHKIRPIFVFDGATPVLKLRTIRNRRLIHERNDSNKRITAQKLLLAKLKQHAISQKLNKGNGSDKSNTNSAFASTFIPPSTMVDGTVQHVEEVVNNFTSSDIEWEEEAEPIAPAKILDEDGSTRHVKADDSDISFFLPDNPDELNLDVMSSLPTYMRKSLIEDARRKERMKSRAAYLPVAGDPALYSQTQLANFLSTSKLNRKFQEVQMKIDGTSVGQKIAADGKKKYLLVDRKNLPEFAESSENSAGAALHNKSPPFRGGFLLSDDDDDGDYYGMDNDMEEEKDAAAALVDDWPSKERAFSSESIASAEWQRASSSEVVDLVESFDNSNRTATQSTPLETIDAQVGPRDSSLVILDQRTAVVRKCNATTKPASDESAGLDKSINVREGNHLSEDGMNLKEEQFYYGSLHVDDSDEDNGQAMNNDGSMDNIEWESNEGDEVSSKISESKLGPDVEDSECMRIPDATAAQELPPPRLQSTMISSEVINRAMNTASNMADWAGRAVRMALRDHVQQTAESNGRKVSQPDATLEDDAKSLSGSRELAPSSPGLKNNLPSPKVLNDAEVDSKQPCNSSSDALLSTLDQVEEEVGDNRRKLSAYMRDSESLTEEMKQEVIELLQVFSLPYIVAPFEAEAQCAVLEQLGLVNGTVTEDSDIFLFGGQTVYRNIFTDKKFVEVYLAEDVKKEMGLEREDLVALAYFLGSDYCEGVHGVGIVNALEILQAFPMKQSAGEGEGQGGGGLMDGLNRFKEWLDGYDFTAEINQIEKKSKKNEKCSSSSRHPAGDTTSSHGNADGSEDSTPLITPAHRLLDFQTKHRTARSKWSVPDSFPDAIIANAYLQPKANYNTEKFDWMLPHVIHVRNYCRDKLGWAEAKMDALVDPAIKNFSERSVQSRIDSHFMTYRDDQRFAKISSSRLQKAVIQITGKRTSLSVSADNAQSKPANSRKRKKPAGDN